MSLKPGETTFQPGARGHADRSFRVVVGVIDNQPLGPGLSLLTSYRDQLDALEAQLRAAQLEQGASHPGNESDTGTDTNCEGSRSWL